MRAEAKTYLRGLKKGRAKIHIQLRVSWSWHRFCTHYHLGMSSRKIWSKESCKKKVKHSEQITRPEWIIGVIEDNTDLQLTLSQNKSQEQVEFSIKDNINATLQIKLFQLKYVKKLKKLWFLTSLFWSPINLHEYCSTMKRTFCWNQGL